MSAQVAVVALDVVLNSNLFSSGNRRVQISRMIAALCVATVVASGPVLAQPRYNIVDIGAIPVGAVLPNSISPGGVVTGYAIDPNFPGFSSSFFWSQSGGVVNLPNLTGYPSSRGNGSNNSGVVVGESSTGWTNNRVPVIWHGSFAMPLPLPAGYSTGSAYAVNDAGNAVGTVGPGGAQLGAVFSGRTASVITQLTSDGSYLVVASGINDAGRIVGGGVNPITGRGVGYVLDTRTNTAFSVGTLPGHDTASLSKVSNRGHVVGASWQSQDFRTSLPVIWTDTGGLVAIPLVSGTIGGGASGVNSSGWVVGTDISPNVLGYLDRIPFLYDGKTTYRLADLIPADSGWNLLTGFNTFGTGISDNGIIVGSGYLNNGEIHAFAMIPVPEPGSTIGLVTVNAVAAAVWRRR
jgi:uncharacterized membrane protein